MKTSLLALSALLSVFTSVPALASSNALAIFSGSIEVTSIISAVEQNRQLKCEPITEQNALLGRHGQVDANIYCNQFDKDGNPQANVTFIKISGLIEGQRFELSQVKVRGVE